MKMLPRLAASTVFTLSRRSRRFWSGAAIGKESRRGTFRECWRFRRAEIHLRPDAPALSTQEVAHFASCRICLNQAS
jgi:hypothetical protein